MLVIFSWGKNTVSFRFLKALGPHRLEPGSPDKVKYFFVFHERRDKQRRPMNATYFFLNKTHFKIFRKNTKCNILE